MGHWDARPKARPSHCLALLSHPVPPASHWLDFKEGNVEKCWIEGGVQHCSWGGAGSSQAFFERALDCAHGQLGPQDAPP